jgi:putative spermidine/putrescine transport system permease protein
VRWWSVAAALYLLLPLVAVVMMSVSPGDLLRFPPSGVSFRWYDQVINSSEWIDAALNSISVAAIAVTIGTVAGTGVALMGRWAPPPWRGRIASLALGPAIMPVIVMAIALFFALAQVRLIGTVFGLGISHAVLVLPLVFIAVTAALEYFDDQLFEAAESLGASKTYAIRTVLLPLVAPAIIVGGVLAFTTSLDEAVVAIFVGGGRMVTIPNLIWRSLNMELSPAVAAVSTIVTIITLMLQILALLILLWHVRRKQRAQILLVLTK